LDKLAAEKRAQAQAAGVKMGPPSKRVKLEPGEDEGDLAANGGVFKGRFFEHYLSPH
jgi:hypothetical protein